MYGKKQFKLHGESIVEGVSRIFETYSPISKNLKDMSLILKKLLMVGIIYLMIMGYLQRYVFILFLFILIANLSIISYLAKKLAEISYLYSKNMGGRTADNIFYINKNLNTITYNVHKMKIEEKRIVYQILKVNKLNNSECVRELKNYYASHKVKKDIDLKKIVRNILSLYFIPITFEIINIYTSIDFNLGLEKDIINILYIVFGSAIIFAIIWIIYSIYRIKQLSATNNYVAPRLENLLLEIMLENIAKKGEKDV